MFGIKITGLLLNFRSLDFMLWSSMISARLKPDEKVTETVDSMKT